MKNIIITVLIMFCLLMCSCFSYRLSVRNADKLLARSVSIENVLGFDDMLKTLSIRHKRIKLGNPSNDGYTHSALSKYGYGIENEWREGCLIGEGLKLYWNQLESIFNVSINKNFLENYLIYIVPNIMNNGLNSSEIHILFLFDKNQILATKEIRVNHGWYNFINDQYNSLYFKYHIHILGDREIGELSESFYKENPNIPPIRKSKGYEVIGGKRKDYFSN